MKTAALAITWLALGVLSMPAPAFAHGSGEHGTMNPADAQMKKLHAMMPVFSTASALLETALEKGDAAAAGAEAGKILAAIPDLKQSRPHRNLKQRKQFIALAARLERSVLSTRELAQAGDFAGALGAFKKVEGTCAACHEKFR